MQNLTCAKCQKPFAPGESMYRHPVERDSRTMERARRLSLRRSRERRARSTKGTKTRSTRGTKNEPNTGVAPEFANPIHFFARVRPKRDPRAVGTMVFVLIDTEKFHRPIGTPSIERMKIVARTFVNESKLRQKFSVELSRHFHAFHPQIDVIKATRFHFMILNPIPS